MKTFAVYLRPKGSVAGQIHSDTLFGAICWAIRAVFGNERLTELLSDFDQQPIFAVSSAFPCLFAGNERVRFYPRPVSLELGRRAANMLIAQTDSARRKKYDPYWEKRAPVEISGKAKLTQEAEYLSERLFSEVVRGQADAASVWLRLVESGSKDDDIESVSNSLLTKAERDLVSPLIQPKNFWRWTDVQRNTIDRVIGSTVSGLLFFSHDLVFDRDLAGLWFALHTDEGSLERLLRPALRYLQDTGFGGDRSAGKGQFAITVAEEPINLPEAETGNCVMLLSRCIPAADEFDFSRRPLAYHLTTLRPKHESRLSGSGHREYKGLLRLLEPGSILPLAAQPSKTIYGRLVRVLDSAGVEGRPVWHCGKAIAVRARIAETSIGGQPNEDR